MLKVKARKISDNPDTYTVPLSEVNFMENLPSVDQPLVLLVSKLGNGVVTSPVVDYAFEERDGAFLYTVNTSNSTYEIEIDPKDMQA